MKKTTTFYYKSQASNGGHLRATAIESKPFNLDSKKVQILSKQKRWLSWNNTQRLWKKVEWPARDERGHEQQLAVPTPKVTQQRRENAACLRRSKEMWQVGFWLVSKEGRTLAGWNTARHVSPLTSWLYVMKQAGNVDGALGFKLEKFAKSFLSPTSAGGSQRCLMFIHEPSCRRVAAYFFLSLLSRAKIFSSWLLDVFKSFKQNVDSTQNCLQWLNDWAQLSRAGLDLGPWLVLTWDVQQTCCRGCR